MPKTCPDCGKNEPVTLRGKLYCGNCGSSLPAAAAPKASAQSAKSGDHHTLDLSPHAKRATHRKTTAAQAVHVPRAGHSASHLTPQTKKVLPTTHKLAEREKRLHDTPRHPQISKFAKFAARADLASVLPATDMNPHLSYALHNLPQEQGGADSKEAVYRLPKPPKTKRRRISAGLSWLKASRRTVATATGVLIALVLVGYVTYLNVPAVAIRVAAVRAGVNAQLPRYRPAGFSYSGPISYSRGQLTVRFVSKSDNSALILTEQTSDWDPSTLLENYVLAKSRNYLPFIVNGLTVYVYNGNNAAWINNGNLYTIEGNTSLTQEQVLNMVTSI